MSRCSSIQFHRQFCESLTTKRCERHSFQFGHVTVVFTLVLQLQLIVIYSRFFGDFFSSLLWKSVYYYLLLYISIGAFDGELKHFCGVKRILLLWQKRIYLTCVVFTRRRFEQLSHIHFHRSTVRFTKSLHISIENVVYVCVKDLKKSSWKPKKVVFSRLHIQ